MIKTAAYFPQQAAQNGGPVLSAVCTSMVWRGIIMNKDSMDADCAVIWSVLWHGRMAKNRQIYEHYRGQGKPVIVIDVGYLRRGVTWRIGVNHINRLARYGNDRDLDLDRPAKLGVGLKRHGTYPEILIAAQHSHSHQVADIPSMAAWAHDRISQIRRYTDRPLVLRPHPRDRTDFGKLPPGVRLEIPRPVPGTYDDFDWHDRYHAVINHNSGPGVLAAIAGVRPVVDTSSLAWPVSVPAQDIEQPYIIDRDRWLIEISHTEYTLQEIEDGTWLKRLESEIA